MRLSSSKEAHRAPEQFSPQAMMLEGQSWEALWPNMRVPEILHMFATAQECNDATKYGPLCELFFFLMRRETDLTDPDSELLPCRR